MAPITLYQFPPLGGLPSMSPFCLKVHFGLRARGLEYDVVDTLFAKKFNPRGKLPVLRRGDETIADSSAILAALDEGADEPFLPREPGPRAEARLLEDWADESLVWHALYFKFVDDDGWAHFGKKLAELIPWPIRAAGLLRTRRHHRALLEAQGLLRRPPGQRQREFDDLLGALETRLGDRAFFVGDAMTIADIAIAAILLPLIAGLTPRAEASVRGRLKLAAWLERRRAELA